MSTYGNRVGSVYREDFLGVRPALHVSLSILSTLTYVGTVTASEDGTVTYQKPGENVTTEGQASETLTTEALTTEAPNTEVPITETPNTEAPKTETPATEGSKTEAPKTEAPKTETPKTDTSSPATQESVQSQKNSPTKFNIANKKTYKLSKKVKVQDADGLKSAKLNGKKLTLKKGKKKLTFKLSKYKKYLKKKGKWNKLVIVDLKGKKKSIQFKTK